MQPTKKRMRINNKRIIPFIQKFYALLFLALAASTTLLLLPIGLITSIVSPYYLIGVILIMLLLLYKLGHQHVEYDSDGEVINIRTKDVFWANYFPQHKTVMDFPKNKLISYKIDNRIFTKTLELFVTSKRSANGVTKLKFNITYLNRAEVSDLKRSLNKIVKDNTEQNVNVEEVQNE